MNVDLLFNGETIKSKFCCEMKYRQVNDGYFNYQTYIQLEDGYFTSFTDLSKDLDISYCNYIKDIINPTSNEKNSNGAFIYVKNVIFIFLIFALWK